MTAEKPYISIIVSAYNEEESIQAVLDDLETYVHPVDSVEYILVNDGSDDATGKIMEDWRQRNRITGGKTRVFHHKTRSGLGTAIITGVSFALGEYILTMDGDGQHRAVDIKKITDELVRSNGILDYVIGKRDSRSHRDWKRAPGKKLLSSIMKKVTKGKIYDFNSGLRAMRKTIFLEWMHLFPKGFGTSISTTIIAANTGLNGKEIPVVMPPRKGGKSRVNQLRDGFLVIWMILKMMKILRNQGN